jgi:ABC-2 type transport system permease protein
VGPAEIVSVCERAPGPAAVWWQLARRSFVRMSTYRGATVAGVFTNSVFGFLRVYVLFAVLEVRPGLGGFDRADAATYTFVTQGMLATVLAFGDLGISARIRSGDIVSDLYRPVDFQGYWLASDVGRAAFHVIFRGVPPVLIGSLVFDLRLPATLGTWAAFGVSVALGVAVSFGARFLVGLAGFWMLDTRGVAQIAAIATMFLAGLMVPLSFLPAGLVGVARWLPFASMSQLSIEVFLGQHPGWREVAGVLGRQAMWAAVLLAVGRGLSARAFAKVVVQGG